MLSFDAAGFVHPWLLAGLLALPVIWWLLRTVPPLPRLEVFPAINFLRGLDPADQSPERTPWWLIALRMLFAALVITGLARPLINPSTDYIPGGLLIVVVDNGWTAAAKWEARQAGMNSLISQAARTGQQIIIVTTARREDAAPPAIMLPEEAISYASRLEPEPWGLDRAAAAERLKALPLTDTQRARLAIVWLSDGLAANDDRKGASDLAQTLESMGSVQVITDQDLSDVTALLEPRGTSTGFNLRVMRAQAARPHAAEVRVLGNDGRILVSAPLAFEAGETVAEVNVPLPAAVRNLATQVVITGAQSTGAVWLLDDQWNRRLAGIVSGGSFDEAQPFLEDAYFLERAMQPFADVRKGAIAELLSAPLSMLVLADIGQIVGEERAQVERWIGHGGLLVRFAGPRMVERSDDLVPVRLRHGGRTMGGTLSWDKPALLAPFPEASPFYGLSASEDVTVSRQVLAEPEAGLTGKAWASLQDGTPLVTAARRGKGWVVLFHVTANTRWSNLPLTGLYVAMLQRISELAGSVNAPEDRQRESGAAGAAPPQRTQLSPMLMLDGRGRLRAPAAGARPLLLSDATSIEVGPRTPPGLYGQREPVPGSRPHTAHAKPEDGGGTKLRAVNLPRDVEDFGLLPPLPQSLLLTGYGPSPEIELRPWLLSAAMLSLLADGVITLMMLGHLPRAGLYRAGAAIAMLGFACIFIGGAASAEEIEKELDRMSLNAVLDTRLAYIITGDAEADAMSAAGLNGLTQILRERTAFEAASPVGVHPDRDELVFYPLLYWPMSENQSPLSAQALSRIDAYMKNGGTILFDTRDELTGFEGLKDSASLTPGQAVLRKILSKLDIPPLALQTHEHVLAKSFYLMRDFPGRYFGGQLWVEAFASGDPAANNNDGVSSIVIGSNDWAAAWAADAMGRPLVPISPGGIRQRELAYRFGVNLVMYTLTGNYKADQVHMPALLERLGQ